MSLYQEQQQLASSNVYSFGFTPQNMLATGTTPQNLLTNTPQGQREL